MSAFKQKFQAEGGVVDVRVEGINMRDYPDLVDAYVSSASWAKSLTPLTDEELDALNDDSALVYDYVWAWVH
jgi:hypothetical protein